MELEGCLGGGGAGRAEKDEDSREQNTWTDGADFRSPTHVRFAFDSYTFRPAVRGQGFA